MRQSAPTLPTKDGVSPSCVALPSGPWPFVLDYLAQRIPAVARHDWAERMARGEVVDAHGQPVPPQAPYRPQSKLYYWRSLPQEHRVPFEAQVIFQDEHLVVADKPHFLPVTPKGRYLQETLLVRLKRQLGIDTLVPMHRIDRETAGLVLLTVQPHTRNAYQSLFRDKQMHKSYEAIAPWHAGLSLPCTRRSRLVESAEQFMVMHEAEGEPNAETTVELIAQAGGWGHYRLTPVTGQKHQLRAHMAAMGLPIKDDRIYPTLLPPEPADQPPSFEAPLQLLARSIAFTDPVTGQARRFDSQRQLVWPPALSRAAP